MEQLAKENDERIRNLEIRMATQEQRMDTVATDVKEIKNTLTWLNRLVLGALVVQILSLVIGKV
ncbi:hemolysin XhlA family protein [Alkalihalobacillus sp. BA299]|uniref:hemolysin XhlA family protein n=1 Tax=Alkalihalobacillus sp. BA299 TaxID=2815938 RepID=UPI001ADA91DB|nr:hemolysin XhlA family protein [Alkalihalobacillus sp. BA299]